MEKLAIKLGAFFRLKKMKFSKLENDDFKQLSGLLEESYNVNKRFTDIKRLINIDKNLKNIWNEIQARAEEENKELKWKYAAIVMDRLFFFLTLIYSLITFCSCVLAIPNLYRSS